MNRNFKLSREFIYDNWFEDCWALKSNPSSSIILANTKIIYNNSSTRLYYLCIIDHDSYHFYFQPYVCMYVYIHTVYGILVHVIIYCQKTTIKYKIAFFILFLFLWKILQQAFAGGLTYKISNFDTYYFKQLIYISIIFYYNPYRVFQIYLLVMISQRKI